MRFGNVAIIGRTNVGKSTFLNAALGEPLAITSALPQTTRDSLLGVVTLPDAQIAFLDTPGLHRPRTELGRRMNAAAVDALHDADLVLMMTDQHRIQSRRRELPAAASAEGEEGDLDPADLEIISQIPAELPCILVLNKVDRCADKRVLLPTIARFARERDFSTILPASAFDPRDVQRLLTLIAAALPERPAAFDADTLTDRPALYFAREYVREQILRQTSREVPHAVAVTIDTANDRGDLLVLQATVHVEKPGQRGILVGERGSRLRGIGTAARERIEALLGRRVYLELFIRVTPRWRHVPRQLAELGYEGRGEGLIATGPRAATPSRGAPLDASPRGPLGGAPREPHKPGRKPRRAPARAPRGASPPRSAAGPARAQPAGPQRTPKGSRGKGR